MAQILLGRAVVVLELDPIAVAGHFLLSAVMVWNTIVLWLKAGARPNGHLHGSARRSCSTAGLVGLVSLVLVVGTLVTGTGPNSGDSRAERLGLDFETIARTHSVTVWCFVLTALWLSGSATGHPGRATIRSEPRPGPARPLAAGGLRGPGRAPGYWQYLAGVPPVLVWFHILGSVTVWGLACSSI